jgi:hypothetical protein
MKKHSNLKLDKEVIRTLTGSRLQQRTALQPLGTPELRGVQGGGQDPSSLVSLVTEVSEVLSRVISDVVSAITNSRVSVPTIPPSLPDSVPPDITLPLVTVPSYISVTTPASSLVSAR